MSTTDEPRIANWSRRVDWWLTGLAVVFLVAYAWSVLDTSLSPAGAWALEAILTGVWALYGIDYVVRLCLAERKWRFVGTHLLDLVVLLLPLLRQLRVLRLIMVIGALNRRLRNDARGKVIIYVVGTVVLVGFVASLAVLEAERNAPDATITSFGQAVWWTLTTISTVGYGDSYPVTFEGRLVAASLMVAGIALLGVVTASLASWFVENLRREEEIAQDVEETEEQLAAVLAELKSISARLDALERDRRPS
jgi:voltage-gated potassium channel